MNKKALKYKGPAKGEAYCDNPGRCCYYGRGDICVNCGRAKGWKQAEAQYMRELFEIEAKYGVAVGATRRSMEGASPVITDGANGNTV